MPDRPADPRDAAEFLNQTLARLRAVERQVTRLPDDADPLQTFDDGSPLGETAFLDFGANLRATLEGDRYVKVVGTGGGPGGWDAIVDSTLTASDEANRLFLGIGEALNFLGPLGLNLNRALVLVRPGTYTETANWRSPSQYTLFGTDGSIAPGTAGGSIGCTWSYGTFTNITSSAHLRAYNMRLNPGVGAPNSGLGFGFFGYNCYLSFLGTAASYAMVREYVWLVNCLIDDMRPLGGVISTAPIVVNQCDILGRGTAITFTSSQVILKDIIIAGSGMTWTVNSQFWLEASSSLIRVGSSGGSVNITGSSSTAYVRLVNHDGTIGAVNLSASSGLLHAHLEGSAYGNITIPTSQYPSTLTCSFSSTVDLTGPATVDLAARFGGSRVILRGDSIAGSVSKDDETSQSSGTFIQFIDADNCVIAAAIDGTGGSGTLRPYSFDSNSRDNVLLLSSGHNYPNPGTDAGTNNRILPEGSAVFTTDGHVIEDEGTPLTQRANLNFVGAGVTVTDSAPDTVVTIPGGGHVIQDEGVSLTQRTNLNFVGAGVTVTDDAGNDQTDVTIAGGGGSGDLLVSWINF